MTQEKDMTEEKQMTQEKQMTLERDMTQDLKRMRHSMKSTIMIRQAMIAPMIGPAMISPDDWISNHSAHHLCVNCLSRENVTVNKSMRERGRTQLVVESLLGGLLTWRWVYLYVSSCLFPRQPSPDMLVVCGDGTRGCRGREVAVTMRLSAQDAHVSHVSLPPMFHLFLCPPRRLELTS